MAVNPLLASTSPAGDAPLDERLCLALYTASRAMTARYRSSLVELGLTYPQYLVMVLLWQEGSSSVSGIGQRLSLDSSTLSPLLKRLQAMGLVTRTRDVRDERLMIIGLTERGQAIQDEAAHVTLEVCEATGMPLSQHAELVETLRELTDRLDASVRRLADPEH